MTIVLGWLITENQITKEWNHSVNPYIPTSTRQVGAGSSMAIVGASGCGKSTVLRLLTRMYDPKSGSIELDGVPLHTLEPRSLRDRVRLHFNTFG